MSDRKHLHAKLSELQQQLGEGTSPKYWRGLEELAETAPFQELMQQEFPNCADVWPDALSRRKFLSLMGASLALAGLSGCSVRPAPPGTIVPYVRQPEAIVPGVPLFFATTMVHGGDAVGLLVESHEGRPTKIEGNPDHPASLGATSTFHQASILTLYDPARSQAVVRGNQISAWDDAERAIRSVTSSQHGRRGSGLRLLTEPVFSPTLGWQIDQFLEQWPEAKWHQYEPIRLSAEHQAARVAFGQELQPTYDFSQADVVLALDADFLCAGPGHLRYARDFMSRRRVRTTEQNAAQAEMNRLYVVETAVSSTGAKADHRLAVRMQDIEAVARAIASELQLPGISSPAEHLRSWASAVARDLKAHEGRCLVVAGARQPPAVHLLAQAMNHHLKNNGQTVRYIQQVAYRPANPVESLHELVDDMRRGEVKTLLILGGNPVYTAPADIPFAEQLGKVEQTFHLSLYQDETSRLCSWHLPEAHYLEAWSDARAFDGTASLVQPLIAPLHAGRSIHEVVNMFGGTSGGSGRELVRAYWRKQQQMSAEDFETFWETSLHDGVIAESAFATVSVALQEEWQAGLSESSSSASSTAKQDDIELVFQEDPTLYDGRYGTNGWLQELPKPITKLTWDNAAIMSPATANELGLTYRSFAHGGEHGGYEVPLVSLQLGQRGVRAPVWIMPGHADGAVTVYLGHGRQYAAKLNEAWQATLGFDAYQLRTAEHPWYASGLHIAKLEGTYPLACTQSHHSMDEREPVRSASLAEFRQAPRQAAEKKTESEAPPVTLYKPFSYDPPQRKWGMVIDTTACLGCNACMVACQAENNIPVVGKEQVLFGREMHWLRVDRYVHGAPNDPEAFFFQPVPCMHCEHAPCEYVCPVAATVHSADGLNDMVYQRCVGTRFCSNNCPYKVRRFNFLSYADFETLPLRLQYNPDVTVRSRGVMEKCTYCVQRIRRAESIAEAAQRPIHDGEVLTACQAACPSQAIVFGDLNDPASHVRQLKESPLEYGLLAELNTFPRTTYLAALRNPNPELLSE
jgi:molybdopterin-containing oxidoreductase family iron-sulfur binding subunit